MSDSKMDVASSDLILYQTADGHTKIEVHLQGGTVWLSQKLMAELFQKNVRTINEHIQNIYDEDELVPESTIRKFRIVQHEGSREVARQIDFYNLDVIISVGYRVSSHRGTQFRIWATQRLTEFLVKLDGFMRISERKVLNHSGKVSHEDALDKARLEYDKYRCQLTLLPSQVEKDFFAAVKKVEQIDTTTNQSGV